MNWPKAAFHLKSMPTVNLPDVFSFVIAQHSRILQSFSTSDMVVSMFFFINVARTAVEALCSRIRDTDAGVRCAATSILPTLELEELNVEGCSKLAMIRHGAVDLQLGRKGDELVSAELQERTKMGAWMACLQD